MLFLIHTYRSTDAGLCLTKGDGCAHSLRYPFCCLQVWRSPSFAFQHYSKRLPGFTLFGLVQLIRHPTLWMASMSPDWPFSETFMTFIAPHLIAASSLAVNLTVTTAIAARIISSRWRFKKIGYGFRSGPGGLLFVVAIMVESALPSTIIGMYCTVAFWVFPSWGGAYVSRMAWVVCTVGIFLHHLLMPEDLHYM